MNLHDFGNMWIYPFNYQKKVGPAPKNFEIEALNFFHSFEREAKKISNAIFGNVIKVLGYYSEGEVSDWMFGEENIISFSPEIGTSDEAAQDFVIPKRLIYPSYIEFSSVMKLFLSKNIPNFTDVFFAFDNLNRLVVNLKNSAVSSLFFPQVVFKISSGLFMDTLKKAYFEKADGFIQSFELSIDKNNGYVTFHIPKLAKLKSYQFAFEFSSDLVSRSSLEIMMGIFNSEKREIWSIKMEHGKIEEFKRIYFLILLVTLCFFVALCFTYIKNSGLIRENSQIRPDLNPFNLNLA